MVKKKSYKKYGSLFSGESNPFNTKVNRQKHSILGSDVKGTKGMPAISKGINYAKRKEFFKKNKLAAQKSNTFIDKRTTNQNASFKDNVTARFVREGQKKNKKSVFNLNSEENVVAKDKTSRGSKIFDDDNLGSDEEDTLGTKLDDSETPKTHKEVMEEIIADSKKKKLEKKMEKEKYLTSLEQVDNAWREIHFMNTNGNPSKNKNKIVFKEPAESNTNDPFDVSKLELKFEPKCSSISHTKNEEELAKEEEKKRVQLEREKISRMNDNKDSNGTKTFTHVSADAICDEYEYLQPITMVEDKLSKVSEESEDSDNESVDSNSSFEESNQSDKDSEVEDESGNEDNMPSLDFDIPQDIEKFRGRVKDCDARQLSSILDSLLKKFINSKNEKILSKLETFFDILLRYALEQCEKKSSEFKLIDTLLPYLHSIANAINAGGAHIFVKLLDEEYKIFDAFKKRNMKRNFPRPQAIVLLKYAAFIYSTSDFRHPVVTPAMIFISDILCSSFNITFVNVLSRLLISELVLKCIADSKRYVPEAVNFLNNVLMLAVPDKCKKPFSKFFNLIINDQFSENDIIALDLFCSNKSITDESKKIGIIFAVINQLLQYATLYSQLPSFKEIFTPALNTSKELPVDFYPVLLKTQIEELIELAERSTPLNQLTFQKIKPKPLKMFEPRFESKFNQKNDLDKKRMQIKKVAQKIRKEEKGMLREIRRDAQVAAAEKLQEKIELDEARKRKVKEIYGSLAMQEGEFKKMMKKKP